MASVNNVNVVGNVIDPKVGRGIILDGYRATPSNNVLIAGNKVTARGLGGEENPTLQGLRIRNNVDAKGPLQNIRVIGNDFFAEATPDKKSIAHAGKISLVNTATVSIVGNTFTATGEGDRPGSVNALTIDGHDIENTTIFMLNELSSTDTCLRLGHADNDPVRNVVIERTKFSQIGTNADYRAVMAGYWDANIQATIKDSINDPNPVQLSGPSERIISVEPGQTYTSNT